MIIPVRCFTCNACIGHLWEEYQISVKSGKTRDQTLTSLGFPPDRYCCRRMFLGHVDIIDDLLMYSVVPGKKSITKHAFYIKALEKETELSETNAEEPDDPSGLDADMEPDIDEEAEYGFRITKDPDSDSESQAPIGGGEEEPPDIPDPEDGDDLEEEDDEDEPEDEPEDDLVDGTYDDD